MKMWDIIGKVGSRIIEEVVPAGGLIVDAVNLLLPDDKKLPANATGEQVGGAIAALPPEQQAQLLSREFDVQITELKETHETARIMLESDAKNPQSTRPYIAKHSFHVVALVIVLVVCTWSYGVAAENDKMVGVIMEGWPFIIAVITPLVVLLHAYFGVLKQEHKARMDAASGNKQPSGIAGVLASMLKR